MMDMIKNSLQFFILVYLASNVKGNGCDNEPKCIRKVFGAKEYYLFKDDRRNWERSKEFCAEKNFQLAAVPEDLRHTDFLKSFVEKVKEKSQTGPNRHARNARVPSHPQSINVWLGGTVEDLTTWEFVNGEKFYNADGAPTCNTVERRCGQLNRLGDKVAVVSRGCHTSGNDDHNYICRIGNEVRIYKKIRITWFRARRKCLRFGGDLYYLTKQQLGASKNLTTELKHLTENGKQYFVGFKNFRQEWLDGSEILGYNPKTKQSGDKSCISMNGRTELLFDGECSVNRYTLCQNLVNTSEVPIDAESPQEEGEGENAKKGKEDEGKEELSDDEPTSEVQNCHTDVCIYVLAALLALSLLVALALGCYIIRKKLQESKAAEMDDLIEMEDNPEYGTACSSNPVAPYHRTTPKRSAGPVAPVAPVVAYEEVTLPNSTSSTRYNGRTVSEVEAAEQETSIYSLAK